MVGAGPAVLIVGPVTWDVFGGVRRPGGSVAFAARTAAALGVRARILTIGRADADMSALDGHDVHLIPSQSTMTFEHSFDGPRRRLRVFARPERALAASDVPRGWLSSSESGGGDSGPGVMVLAPLLADDVDVGSFARVGFERVALLGQGLQRVLDGSGLVMTAGEPSAALAGVLSDRCSLFLSDEECSSWAPGELDAVVGACERVVVTRGAEGAEVLMRSAEPLRVEPVAARVVDTTGAGDVFSTAFFLGVTVLGLDAVEAGVLASRLAAAKVGRVGAVALPRV